MSKVKEKGISQIYSYLVLPGKGDDTVPDIAGAELELKGKVFKMLREIYESSEKDCKIPICFDMGDDGKQENKVRDEVIAFVKKPSEKKGRVLANDIWMYSR
ncbi:hypothetical protein H6783_01465 [Candidatus Nomurabacteria bacterium]|nr:hypothetical protein [Candidatus Nomurabacteria bacterium]